HPPALVEDVAQQAQVVEVGGRDPAHAHRPLVLLARVVGRRSDDEGDAAVLEVVHVTGVAAHQGRLGVEGDHAVVGADLGRTEAAVELAGVVAFPLADAEGRGGGAHGGTLPGGGSGVGEAPPTGIRVDLRTTPGLWPMLEGWTTTPPPPRGPRRVYPAGTPTRGRARAAAGGRARRGR